MEFERLWSDRRETPARGAKLVESVAFVFPSADGAAAALRVAPDLARYVLLDQERVAPSAEPVSLGDEAKVLAKGRNFSIVWRRGTVVALLHVRGRSAGNAGRVAVALARRQEARIEKPTPLPPGANDDVEVALDNPRLGIRVYWLGRRFAPGHGLPGVKLVDASGPNPPEEPGNTARLEYRGRGAGVSLDLYKPRRWRRYIRSKLGREFWTAPCARKRTLLLAHGYADVYAGYSGTTRPPPAPTPAARRASASCPKRRPDAFVAHVYLSRVVIAVNMPTCFRCEPVPGAYSSLKGLTAVARGLRLRRR